MLASAGGGGGAAGPPLNLGNFIVAAGLIEKVVVGESGAARRGGRVEGMEG